MNKETEVVETVEDVEKVTAEPEEHQEEPKDEKKYTDADVDKIINKKFAKWKEEAEKAEKEAEKLRKMSMKLKNKLNALPNWKHNSIATDSKKRLLRCYLKLESQPMKQCLTLLYATTQKIHNSQYSRSLAL